MYLGGSMSTRGKDNREINLSMEDSLLPAVLKRKRSLFFSDYSECQPELLKNLKGSRVLVLGAAGSVGSAVVKKLSEYELSSLNINTCISSLIVYQIFAKNNRYLFLSHLT